MTMGVYATASLAPGCVEQAHAATVKISKKSVTMDKGDTYTLKLKNATTSKIAWSSNKTSVAYVSKKGVVKAKNVGKAVVTAKYSGKKYKCTVTVINPQLNTTSISLHPGQSYTLELSEISAKSWKSSNSSIATVTSSGVVAAKTAGPATITCTGRNGKNYTCRVEVVEHSYAETVTAPTCTENGYTTYTCPCGHSYVGAWVKATGHHHVDVVTAPTCTEGGYTTHTCSCGHQYVDTWTNATGHTPVIDKAVEPTFTSTGLTEGSHCSTCGLVLVPQEVIPKSRIEKFDTSQINIDFEPAKTGTYEKDFPYCSYKISSYSFTADKSYAYIDHNLSTPEDTLVPFTLKAKVTCTTSGRYVNVGYAVVDASGNSSKTGSISYSFGTSDGKGTTKWVSTTVYLPAVAGTYTVRFLG